MLEYNFLGPMTPRPFSILALSLLLCPAVSGEPLPYISDAQFTWHLTSPVIISVPGWLKSLNATFVTGAWYGFLDSRRLATPEQAC